MTNFYNAIILMMRTKQEKDSNMKISLIVCCIAALISIGLMFSADAGPPQNATKASVHNSNAFAVTAAGQVLQAEPAISNGVELATVKTPSLAAPESRFDLVNPNPSDIAPVDLAALSKPPEASFNGFDRPNIVLLL